MANYKKQMEMFDLGGLKDQGETVDRKSRNKVPVGSLKKEVRDDVPINISEGEFVLPAEELVDRVPGVMVPEESAARVVLESHFPRFKTYLKQNQFFNGETVIDDIGQVGEIARWKPESNQLTIFS